MPITGKQTSQYCTPHSSLLGISKSLEKCKTRDRCSQVNSPSSTRMLSLWSARISRGGGSEAFSATRSIRRHKKALVGASARQEGRDCELQSAYKVRCILWFVNEYYALQCYTYTLYMPAAGADASRKYSRSSRSAVYPSAVRGIINLESLVRNFD